MARNDMQRVYRLLLKAREQGIIPWEWIVDETRSLERVSTWDDPERVRPLRRPILSPRLLEPAAASRQVWSEKGTVRGVLAPVLDHYAVGFNAVHGFSSAHQRPTTLPRMTTVAH